VKKGKQQQHEKGVSFILQGMVQKKKEKKKKGDMDTYAQPSKIYTIWGKKCREKRKYPDYQGVNSDANNS